MEKYMSFTIQQPKKKAITSGLPLVFINSVQFLNNSLDNLVKNLAENGFYDLSQDFNVNALNLKGFFPYDHWDSFEKFKEGLPGKGKFYNTLTNRAISDKNYEHIFSILKALEMNTMKDYHDFCLKVDVLFSTCVFEAF